MTYYRVFPYDTSAASNEPGGALFVPPSSGLGRIDNPQRYGVLYLARHEEAAIAERFGNLAVWRHETFVHAALRLPYAIAAYTLPDDALIFDLDDVAALQSLGLTRPTEVITRHRRRTQAWALKIFRRGSYIGATWWSYYNPDWPVAGLWDIRSLRTVGAPAVLSTSSSSIRRAADAIARQIVP